MQREAYVLHMVIYTSQAQLIVADLEEKLQSLESLDLDGESGGREIRVWMDGAFDMMHYGHMNAFR